MVSPALQQLLEVLPKNFADPNADYVAVRAMFAPFHGHPVPDDLQIAISDAGGVRIASYSSPQLEGNPQTQSVTRTVFHCHGGAFVSCPLDVYHFYAEMIMRLTHSKVVMPDYRLAPEQPYPAALDDCFNAYRGLLDSGIDPQTIYFFGESCGGSLAVGTLLRARDAGLPMPRCFVSLTGWFDLTVADTATIERDPFLTPDWIRNRAHEYLAGVIAPNDPLVSPAYADLTGLPPMYLQIGQYDTVREGAIKLAANAVRDGVQVTMESWPGMIHGWQGLANMQVPEALEAWRRIKEYLDKI